MAGRRNEFLHNLPPLRLSQGKLVEGEMDIESLRIIVAFIAVVLIAAMWKNVADGNRRGR